MTTAGDPTVHDENSVDPNAWPYQLASWALNVTPSFEDLILAGPRLVQRISSFTGLHDYIHASADSNSTQSYVLVDKPSITNPAVTAAHAQREILNMMVPNTAAGADAREGIQYSKMDGSRGLGSIFGYATSRWAITCIAMAIILNRTHIFAATRRRLRLKWPMRLLLRAAPIVLLLAQIRTIIQSIQCQTSADFANLRWGDATMSSDLLFAYPNQLLNSMSSILLLGASDEQSCVAVNMIPSDDTGSAHDLRGSLSILWPLFGTFCASHFLETISCAIQGRPLASETALTLFEQSLAFAEADTAISNQLGTGVFLKVPSGDPSGASVPVTRAMILSKVNTAPETLLIALLSAMTHLTSHVLGLFDLQAKYRLLNTAFWGLCFMASILWNAYVFDLNNPASQGLLRFPTVCIISFLPHVLVLFGVLMCMGVYGLAIILSAFAPPESQRRGLNFRQRLVEAHQNMQANVSLSDLRITREMDIYTALLRTGFAAITMASEAVYLNEDRDVSLKRHTWLEEERYKEAEELQQQWMSLGLPTSRYDQVGAIGLIPVKGGSNAGVGGYSRERAAQKIVKGRGERGVKQGVGANERSSRWLMAIEFMFSVSKLVARIFAIAMLWCLKLVRITYEPEWLLSLARRPKNTREEDKAFKRAHGRRSKTDSNGFDKDGRISRGEGIDVEDEFRRTGVVNDDDIDSDLYSYWLKGGWWGSKDNSGDYLPEPDEDNWDITSVVSTAAGFSEDEEDGWSSEDSGQKTPTQRSPIQRTPTQRPSQGSEIPRTPMQRVAREGTPLVDSPLAMSDLARLLHPQSQEEREDAEVLSAHFDSDAIMTRASFKRLQQLKRTRVLTGVHASPSTPKRSSNVTGVVSKNVKLTPDEEERILEQLLLSRRNQMAERTPLGSPGVNARGTSWEDGASGLGSDGPQCVVCQSTPRTIIVWPCRCLSLCDDCRVSLAMNNFDKCVCCRREVASFSRIFVP